MIIFIRGLQSIRNPGPSLQDMKGKEDVVEISNHQGFQELLKKENLTLSIRKTAKFPLSSVHNNAFWTISYDNKLANKMSNVKSADRVLSDFSLNVGVASEDQNQSKLLALC